MSMNRAVLVALVVVTASMAGCKTVRASGAGSAAPKSAKECAACARMCEVAGTAEKGEATTANVQACQDDCAGDCH